MTTDMVIYFRPGTPLEETQRVWDDVLKVPTARGFNLAPGVTGVDACEGPPGTQPICVHFARGAPRVAVRAKAERWPSVLRVLEDVVPAEVRLADLGG